MKRIATHNTKRSLASLGENLSSIWVILEYVFCRSHFTESATGQIQLKSSGHINLEQAVLNTNPKVTNKMKKYPFE